MMVADDFSIFMTAKIVRCLNARFIDISVFVCSNFDGDRCIVPVINKFNFRCMNNVTFVYRIVYACVTKYFSRTLSISFDFYCVSLCVRSSEWF